MTVGSTVTGVAAKLADFKQNYSAGDYSAGLEKINGSIDSIRNNGDLSSADKQTALLRIIGETTGPLTRNDPVASSLASVLNRPAAVAETGTTPSQQGRKDNGAAE